MEKPLFPALPVLVVRWLTFAAVIAVAHAVTSCGNAAAPPTSPATAPPAPQSQALLLRPVCPQPSHLAIDDLGTFGLAPTQATDINELGHVSGYSRTPDELYRAFFHAGAGMVYPGQITNVGRAAFGRAINDQGDMVLDLDASGGGLYVAGVYHTSSGTWGATTSGYGYAADINSSGVIAGISTVQVDGQWTNRAARFSGSGTWEPIGDLGGRQSGAEGIANDGTIVGWAHLSTTPISPDHFDTGHAFVWRASSGLVDLNTTIDGRLGWELAKANDISPDGNVIVGYGFLDTRNIRAFRYRHGQIENLGAGPGTYISYATGTNNRGDVAGSFYPTGEDPGLTNAMAYTDDMGFINLNDLLAPDSGWVLRHATAINSNRQIVGNGTREGQTRAFRLQLPMPCDAAAGREEADNLIPNGTFEGSLSGWWAVYQNGTPPEGTISVAHETVDAHGTQGALRVKQGPYATPQAVGGANGAYAGLGRGVLPYEFFTISFWAKSISGDPAMKLGAFFGGVHEHSDPLVSLTNEWRHYEMQLYGEHYHFGSLGFGLLKNDWTTGEGEFLIDDIVVRQAPRCKDVVAGEIRENLYCRIERDLYPTQEVRVSFDARAPLAYVNLATTGWLGRYQGEGFMSLDGNWRRVEFNLPVRQLHEVLSLRAVAAPGSQDSVPSVPGIFEVRNFNVEGVMPCEPVDPSNLVDVSTFKCGRHGYRSWLHNQAEPGNRDDLIKVQLIEDGPNADGTKALNVTIPVFPPDVTTYPHNYGLWVQSREPVNQGDYVRVAFDAKRTDPLGSRFLMFNRAWGGDLGFTTVTLNDEWQHYELTVKHQFNTGVYTFVLMPSKTAGIVSPPTAGAFAIDNLRIERLPLCNEALDVTREGLATCALPADAAVGSQVKLMFDAQSIAGSSTLKVTRPWGLDLGAPDVALTSSLAPHEVNITVEQAGEPLTFRLADGVGGQPRQDPAAGRFRLSNVRFAPASDCNNNAGLASTMARNGGFECDDGWWGLARYDSNSQSYVASGLSKQLLPPAEGRSQALRVVAAAPPAGVESRNGMPAGVRFSVKGFPISRWVQVEFDARRADPAGSPYLRVYPTSAGENWVTLTDEWKHHRVSMVMRYAFNEELYFFLSQGPFAGSNAAPGAFDIDNVVIRQLEECGTATLGPHDAQYDCAIPAAYLAKMDYKVVYEARALDGARPFSVTRPEGYWLGSDLFDLGTEWETHVAHVRFRNVYEPAEGLLSFRVVDRARSYFQTYRGQGQFELRNVRFEESTCPQRMGSLVMNEDFECSAGYWQSMVLQHGTPVTTFRSDLIDLGRVPDGVNASAGALLVTQKPGLQDIENHTHTTGALFVLRENIALGETMRMSFDAKLAPGHTGPPYLRFNRTWGGTQEPTTVTLSAQWQHFELTVKENYGAHNYLFVLQTTDSQSAIATPAVGAYMLDNVVFERVVSGCAADGSEGKACDDGNACTVNDRCAGGACVGAAKVCDDGDACTVDSCSAGLCVYAPEPGGAACCSQVVGGERLTVSSGALLYAQNWESCGDAMETLGEGGDARYEDDFGWVACAPNAGAKVATLDEMPLRTSWFAPIPVVAGEVYCLSAAFRSGTAGAPYASIVFADSSGTEGAPVRLIESVTPVMADTASPSSGVTPKWRYVRDQFNVPTGAQSMRIELGIDAGVAAQADSEAAVDDLQLVRGSCVP